MQFYDEVKINIKSGKWWDWVACGRRESTVPHWWPSGWDGWHGWSIIFVASKDENTLLAYKYQKNFKAKYGENWKSKDKYWANSEDLTLPVPVGTIIKDANSMQVLYTFTEDKEKWTALKWWKGWLWNIHFKDSVNQYPDFALFGEPGNEKEIVLELQLLWDVALIGTPSVWKSTIINSVSNTKAKTAEYHFTTLVPNLGSVKHGDFTFNVIDIPWLIKWAADGKWLWNAFLRHILKSRIFCLVTDVSRYENWMTEITELLQEIMQYTQEKLIWVDKEPLFEFEEKYWMINFKLSYDWEVVFEKIMIFAINKYDLLNDEEILNEYKKTLFNQINIFLKQRIWKTLDVKVLDHNTIVMSGYTRFWLDNRLNKIILILENLKNLEVEANLTQSSLTNEGDAVWEVENVQKKTSKQKDEFEPIVDITEKEKQILLDKWYIDELGYKFCKVWEIRNVEICKYVFILPWWNQEAENWFWKHLHERWYVSRLEENKISKWDILKIVSYYSWTDDRYIVY